MAVQSIRFSLNESPFAVNRGRGWTVNSARAWLLMHGYRAPLGGRTANQVRFRQFDPEDASPSSFSTRVEGLPRGVQFVEAELATDNPSRPARPG